MRAILTFCTILLTAICQGAEPAAPGQTATAEEYRASLLRQLPASVETVFDKLDANGDRRITLGEFGSERVSAFRDFDANGDKAIDAGEYLAGKRRASLMADLAIAYMIRWDEDRNGLLERREFRGRPAAFTEADADENNRLHLAELMAMLRDTSPLQYSPDKFLAAHDLDGDGLVDEREWLKTESDETLFRLIDADRDGTMTLEEAKTFLFRYERRLAPLPTIENAS
ncbi:MAG: transaldolase/EF-hand domain-containing protein [candidate division BRC1 bacterium ADurb.BinA364]|nr:MAG: transaldolase/EF-hand domain-containing protein [candidate division BRC1 bacterium ADurb.BinA364]